MSYVGIRRVTYHGLPDKVTMSIPTGIGAVGLAASLPNWLLCCVVREGTSWGKDAWWRWRQNRRKKSGRRRFLQHAQSISINDGGRRRPLAAIGPHSWLLSIQQSANILGNRTTLLKLEKISLTLSRLGMHLGCILVVGIHISPNNGPIEMIPSGKLVVDVLAIYCTL